MFEVGKQVVCVHDNWCFPAPNGLIAISAPTIVIPVKGCVYTVRDFAKDGGLYLQEIINPCNIDMVLVDGRTCHYGWEVSFSVKSDGRWNFRPVKETSIEVLRKLLVPIRELIVITK